MVILWDEILGAYIPTILGYNGGPIPYIGGIQPGYPTIQGNFPRGIRKLGGLPFVVLSWVWAILWVLPK